MAACSYILWKVFAHVFAQVLSHQGVISRPLWTPLIFPFFEFLGNTFFFACFWYWCCYWHHEGRGICPLQPPSSWATSSQPPQWKIKNPPYIHSRVEHTSDVRSAQCWVCPTVHKWWILCCPGWELMGSSSPWGCRGPSPLHLTVYLPGTIHALSCYQGQDCG